MPVQAASSGYPQYSGSLVIPVNSEEILAGMYARTIFTEITNSDYLNDVSNVGDTVIFTRPPRITIREYVTNQPLVVDTPEISTCKMTIGRQHYFSTKLDAVTEAQMNLMPYDTFTGMLMDAASTAAKEHVDSTILCSLYAEAHCANRGINAGVISGGMNLGAPGAPLAVTGDNVRNWIVSMQVALDQQNVPKEDRFLVVPSVFALALNNSPWAGCCFDPASQTLYTDGGITQKIAGFTIYESNAILPVLDPVSRQKVYNILAGWKDATGFAVQMQETRIISTENSFGKKFEGLMIWDFHALYPEALVHSVVTF